MNNKPTNQQIIRDPSLARSRIFVGNLPTCTREELESICYPYAQVLGSMVQKNFGFVQFESETVANKVAAALTKSTFKGNTIIVRNAGANKQAPAQDANTKRNVPDKIAAPPAPSAPPPEQKPDYNDCEIIVLDRMNTDYAEKIEERLTRLNMRVDVLFPNDDVPLGKVLANISSRGCLYAVVVTNQHQEHNSVTVNILYDRPAEHRNMPVEDAIQLITDDFHKKIARTTQLNITDAATVNLIKALPLMNNTTVGPQPFKERHPNTMQSLINLLAQNKTLTVLQYDSLIKYLQNRRQMQMKVELGDPAEEHMVPDPELELQKKILAILKKPSVAEMHYKMLYTTLQDVKEDHRMIELLRDRRIQRALNSLMCTALVPKVESYMRF